MYIYRLKKKLKNSRITSYNSNNKSWHNVENKQVDSYSFPGYIHKHGRERDVVG